MRLIDKCTKYIRSLLKAPHCYLCDSRLEPSLYDICKPCLEELPYINLPCRRCSRQMKQGQSPVCGACLSQPPAYDVLFSPFDYRFPIDKLVTELKFRHKLYSAFTLGQLFSQFIQTKATPLPECIIPVPLHPQRLRQRGYNQSLEIARVISKNLNIPIDSNFCIRTKNTKPQSDLNAKDRLGNVKNAFQINNQHTYKHVALFDDVVTTGYTVDEVARLLRQHNITVIQVWSIARVNSK